MTHTEKVLCLFFNTLPGPPFVWLQCTRHKEAKKQLGPAAAPDHSWRWLLLAWRQQYESGWPTWVTNDHTETISWHFSAAAGPILRNISTKKSFWVSTIAHSLIWLWDHVTSLRKSWARLLSQTGDNVTITPGFVLDSKILASANWPHNKDNCHASLC